MTYHCALKARGKFPLTISHSFVIRNRSQLYSLQYFRTVWSKPRTPKHRTPEHRPAKHRNVMIPITQVRRENIISYCCHVMSYWYNISHWCIIWYWYIYIIIIHRPDIISHHADIISCYHIVWYHIISYNTDMSIANTISYLYIGAATSICVTKFDTMLGPNCWRWNWKFLN